MITLSSDSGSPYPAAMKGVIAQHSEARLVDVAHQFPRQSAQTTAFWLRELLPYFPPAVHLVAVAPGPDRAELVVRAGEHAFVGPDNGVLLPPARELADDYEAYRLAEFGDGTGSWPPDPGSSTFRGRDVFAPMAAHVHEQGVTKVDAIDALEPTTAEEPVSVPEPTVEDDAIRGEVLAVDDFGTAVTNIPGDLLTDHDGTHVRVNGTAAQVRRSAAAVEAGKRVVTAGSHGTVELTINGGRGTNAFSVHTGSDVVLRW